MGKFIIKETKTGFTFRLKASNQQTVCASQLYKTMSSCKAGIESLKRFCGSQVEDQTLKTFEPLKNPKYEIYLDKAGQYRFRLKANNGEILIISEDGYATKSGCKGGIESIAKNAPDAEIQKAE